MARDQVRFLFLNVGHFLDHFVLLIFATAAAVSLTTEFDLSYGELIPYATPGFVAFGLFAVPAGWLADRWSREGMMAVFFFGIGGAAVLTSFTSSPFQMAIGLTILGVFAAIYHPVGLAMVVEGRTKTGVPLAINGVFGNMGVASAALLTGFLIDTTGWRAAFWVPGFVSILAGATYLVFLRVDANAPHVGARSEAPATTSIPLSRQVLVRGFAIVFFTTAIGGLIFQSTTFAMPKVVEERLGDLADTSTLVGWYAFLIFSLAALAQLVVGYLVDHHSVRRVFLSVAGLQILFFALMAQLTGLLALATAIAFMLAVFGQIPINDVLIGRMAKSEWRSRAYAFRYIISFSVSATAVPMIAWIHTGWGFDALFGTLSVCATLIFCAVLFLPKIRSQ